MAQINLKDIQRIEKNRNIVHEKVHATYTVFQSDGEKYVQLDMLLCLMQDRSIFKKSVLD